MENCTITHCKNRSDTSSNSTGITYHIFPNQSHLRQEWIKFCDKISGWVPPVNAVICSNHFASDCWSVFTDYVRLSDTAVPTIRACKCPDSGNENCTTNDIKNEHEDKTSQSQTKAQKIEKILPKITKRLEKNAKKTERLEAKILYIQKKLDNVHEMLDKLRTEAMCKQGKVKLLKRRRARR